MEAIRQARGSGRELFGSWSKTQCRNGSRWGRTGVTTDDLPDQGSEMESLNDFLTWAWARHHNPLSWYIRPLFVLPFCYFAYKKSVAGLLLTVGGVLSSMFWFPAPSEADPRAAAFLAMEREYVTGGWTWAKTAMTALVPVWFVVLGLAFWRRSLIAGLVVINVGAALKVIWSFYFGGDTAWSIVLPVSVGAVVCNGILLFVFRRRLRPGPAG